MATGPSAMRRIPLLALASILGALILVAHIITLGILPNIGMELVTFLAGTRFEFSIPRNELRDLGLHMGMFTLFTLSYRLSWRSGGPAVRLATIMLCSGWGMFCESLQIFIHRRDFSLLDLGVNMLTPMLVVGLTRLFERK
ncbi:hypothetical protein KDL29_15090 [bacterium]|nr:hypothetical protein [bacterium]